MHFTVAQPFFAVGAYNAVTITDSLDNGSYILVSNQDGSVYQIMGMAFITITNYANGCTYTPIVGGDWFNQITVTFEEKQMKITNPTEARTFFTIYKL